jgi:hypothetical protein
VQTVSTLTITLVTALIILGIWWLLRPGEPSANEPLTPEMLQAVIETLLYQGLDGGELRIATRDGTVAFRFIKYVRPQDAGILGELSKVPDHEGYFQSFLGELVTRDIAHHLLKSTPDAVRIDFGRDVGQARFVTILFFERSMGVRLARDCVAYFNDKVLPINSPLTGIARTSRT